MSTGPSVSSISSRAALEQRRSSNAAFGSPRGGPVPGCHGQVLSVNLDGVSNCSQIFGRGMVARGHGSIIYIVVVLVGGITYAIIRAGKPNAEPLLRNLGAPLVPVVYFAAFGCVASFLGRADNRRPGARHPDRPARRWLDPRVAGRRPPIGVFITAAFWFISLFAVVIGRQKRTPSDALTGTVVIKPIKAPRPGRQPSRPADRRGCERRRGSRSRDRTRTMSARAVARDSRDARAARLGPADRVARPSHR